MAFNPSMLPNIGQAPWGEDFNDAYTELFNDTQDALASAAASAQSAADAAALVGAPAGNAIDAYLGGPSSGLAGVVARKGDLVRNVLDYANLVGGPGLDWDKAWQAAVDAAPAGGVVFCPDKTERSLSQAVVLSKPVTVVGGSVQTAADGKAFSVRSSDVTIRGVRVRGPGVSYVKFNRAIEAKSTSAAPFDRVRVEDCTITDSPDTAVWFEWVTNSHVRDCTIKDFAYAGVMVHSGTDCMVVGNNIRDAHQDAAVGNSYGIAVSDLDNTVAARSRHVTVAFNRIHGVPDWEGIDTHGGEGIKIIGNTVTACKRGIQALVGNQPPRITAPQLTVIVGNVVDGTGGTIATTGISLLGMSDLSALASGVAAANVVANCTTPVQLAQVDAAGTIVRSNVGADGVWKAYVPTYNGTLGNGTLTGRHMFDGNTVHWGIRFVVGSTTVIPGGSGARFGLPAAIANAAIPNLSGAGVKVAGASSPPVSFRAASGTELRVFDKDGLELIGGNAFATSMTAGTEIRLSGTYERA